ncbi:MAG: hypothetical protein ABJE95_05755 [Byssovorax sp.]
MKHPLRAALPLVLPLIALVAAACSSGSTPTGSGGTTGQTTGSGTTTTGSDGTGGASTSSAAGTGGGDIACKGSDHSDPNAPKVTVGTVTVKIVDLMGNPAPSDFSVQVCGTNLCFYGKSSQPGQFAVIGSATPLQQPLFKFGDARGFAKLGIPITAATLDAMGNEAFGTLTTAALPVDGAVITPGKTITSGEVTLTLPAGGVAVIDDSVYPEAIDQQFRAVTIPIAKATEVLAAAPAGIEQLYGVGPLETVFCPAATVTVPNADAVKWPAGTDVELWILGLDGASQEWAPYGGWIKVSDGKVSADGKTISTTTTGLPLLSTFGIRKKP